EVDVEFMRVRDAELSTFFANYQRSGQRGSWELDTLSRVADSVYSNRFVLTGRENERSVSFLPVQNISELREPGLYFAVLRRPGQFDNRFETSFFFVSDLGLHARLHRDSLWLHAASLATGEARGGVRVEILNEKGQSVASGSTDPEGNLSVDYRMQPQHVLVAREGSDVSLISFRQPALDLADFDIAEVGQIQRRLAE